MLASTTNMHLQFNSSILKKNPQSYYFGCVGNFISLPIK